MMRFMFEVPVPAENQSTDRRQRHLWLREKLSARVSCLSRAAAILRSLNDGGA